MNSSTQIQNINVDLIIPNRFQPRLTFDENALNELAKSIKEHGIIQPIVLRKLNDKYEIIAGERRYKAACLAGLSEVPALITKLNDNESAEVALVENVQRKNLNSMEEAKSYKKILDRGYLTQEALAKKMGINQSTLANKLRLLNLADEVQEALVNNRISERHARSLLTIDDKLRQVSLLNRVIGERLTVRQLDELIKNDNNFSSNDQNVLTPVIEAQNEPVNNFEPVNANVNILDTKFVNDIEPDNTVSNSVIGNEKVFDKATFEVTPNVETDVQSFNIFDNPLNNNEIINQTNELLLDENKIEDQDNSLEQNEKIESLDSLDLDENEEIPNDNDSKTSSILDFFKVPTFSSLEDEATNLNTGTDDYFNPFNNNLNEEIKTEKEVQEENSIQEGVIEEKKDEAPVVVVPEKNVKKGDLSSVKKAYDDLKNEIEEAGFKISTEDFDFEDIYQIIIKIDKQD